MQILQELIALEGVFATSYKEKEVEGYLWWSVFDLLEITPRVYLALDRRAIWLQNL